MTRRLRLIGWLTLTAAILWLPLASFLLSTALHMAGVVRGPASWTERLVGWPIYWWLYRAHRDIGWWLPVTAGSAGLLLSVIPIVGLFVPIYRGVKEAADESQRAEDPKTSTSGAHGSARWLKEDEIARLYRTANPVCGGIPIGENYQPSKDSVAHLKFDPRDRGTWGRGGKAELLLDPCTSDATHGVVISGSGGGKTAATTIPVLDTWTGSTVNFDPAGQAGKVAAKRRRQMGHKVYTIAPGQHGINVLDWIDPSKPTAEIDVLTVLDWVGGEIKREGENAVFAEGARAMEAAILADMLWDPNLEPERRTLDEFRTRIRTPEAKMQGFLEDIEANTRSRLASHYASELKTTYKKTFSGVYRHAGSETAWLSIQSLSDMVSRNSFDPADLTKGNVDVFVQVNEDVLKSSAGVARTVIGALKNAVYQAEGDVAGRVLFLLDECRFLGKLSAISDIRDGGRKYGITMITMWPGIGSLRTVWGAEEADLFIASAAWSMFAAIGDEKTAKYVSELCGKRGVLVNSEGVSKGVTGSVMSSTGGRSSSRSWNTSEQARSLITVDEVLSMRADEAIVFQRSSRPLRCGRPFYFRRPDMKARMDPDRFVPRLVATAEGAEPWQTAKNRTPGRQQPASAPAR